MRTGKTIILTAAFLACMASKGVERADTTRVMTIDGYPITRSYFDYSYAKNGGGKSQTEYLDEFLSLQLKSREARAMALDTAADYVNALENKIAELQTPYAMSAAMQDSALQSEFERSKTNLKVRQIYFGIGGNGSPADTLKAYQKALTALRLLDTDPFDSVVVWMSEEQSARRTHGYLPWVSAGNLPYPLENAIYEAKEGTTVGPVRTPSAYHLVQVVATRPDPGNRIVRHLVCLKDLDDIKRTERDQAQFQADYDKLRQAVQRGEGDTFFDSLFTCARNVDNGGGTLFVTVGNVLPEIENEAIALSEPGDISILFDSPFGFHVLRLDSIIEKNPDTDIPYLAQQCQHSGLFALLRWQYARTKASLLDLQENKRNYKKLSDYCAKQGWNDSLIMAHLSSVKRLTLYTMTVNGKTRATTVSDLFDYMQTIEGLNAARYWIAYEDKLTDDLIANYLEKLIDISDDYANQLREFSDTQLSFRLLRVCIWNEGERNKDGLQRFFERHRERYGNAPTLHGIRGRVKADYEDHLEKELETQLRSKHRVTMNEAVVSSLR